MHAGLQSSWNSNSFRPKKGFKGSKVNFISNREGRGWLIWKSCQASRFVHEKFKRKLEKEERFLPVSRDCNPLIIPDRLSYVSKRQLKKILVFQIFFIYIPRLVWLPSGAKCSNVKDRMYFRSGSSSKLGQERPQSDRMNKGSLIHSHSSWQKHWHS